MKPKKRHLKFYKDYMKEEQLPEPGLCNCAKNNKYINQKLLDIMSPQTIEELSTNYVGLVDNLGILNKNYPWGYDGVIARRSDLPTHMQDYDYSITYDFSPLRQTIVLFMAAMNGEL